MCIHLYSNIYAYAYTYIYVCVQFSSVAQSCLTLLAPWTAAFQSLPVHHQLPEFTQTQVH